MRASGNYSWSYTAFTPLIGPIDARAILPMAVWALHMSWLTFYIAVAGVAFFWVVYRLGYSPSALLFAVIRSLMGSIRPVVDRYTIRKRCRWSWR